jgi:hypothetical protein
MLKIKQDQDRRNRTPRQQIATNTTQTSTLTTQQPTDIDAYKIKMSKFLTSRIGGERKDATTINPSVARANHLEQETSTKSFDTGMQNHGQGADKGEQLADIASYSFSENDLIPAAGEAVGYDAYSGEQTADVSSNSFSENDLIEADGGATMVDDAHSRDQTADVSGNSFSENDLIPAAGETVEYGAYSREQTAYVSGNSFSDNDLIAAAREAMEYDAYSREQTADISTSSFSENDLIEATRGYDAHSRDQTAGNSFRENDLIAAAGEPVPYASVLDTMELGCPALLSCVELSKYIQYIINKFFVIFLQIN